MLESIWRCPAPVVARIQGYALGGGSGLTACVDIARRRRGCGLRLLRGAARDHPGGDLADGAGEDRPATTRGATSSPASGSTRQTALRIGLVDEVAEDLDAAVERVVADILAGGPTAVREAKRLVLEPGGEEDLLARAANRRTSDEGQDGLRAFLEKRPPGWASGSSS